MSYNKLAATMPQDQMYNATPVLTPKTGTIKLDGTSASDVTNVIDANYDKVVRIAAADQIWVAIGAAPTAVADTTMLMFAESTECFHIAAGEKIAVLGGIAYITIME